MGIFATSFIMPVSAEETTTNEIQIADNDNSYGDKADAYIPEANINDQQTDDNSISTYNIIGHDDRKLVKSPDKRIALLKIHYPDGSVLNGTAWIFAKRALMTAGHCIHNNSYGGTATKTSCRSFYR